MKKTLIALCFALIATTVFAQQAEIDQMTSSLDGFLKELNTATPDNAVTGGTWSDAYIGQLLGIPPHFGVGFSTGVSRLPAKGLDDFFKLVKLDSSLPIPITDLVIPTASVEARIGGIIFPFDLGVKFMYIPEQTVQPLKFDYMNFGFDIRYPVIKENIVLPGVSIGAGYAYVGGSLGATINFAEAGGFPAEYGTDEKLAVKFSTNVFDVKAQVSKTFLIVTPYAGVGLSMSQSVSDYTIVTESKKITTDVFGARVFGGLSFNIVVIKLDTTVMYNVVSGNWGVNFGTRLQI